MSPKEGPIVPLEVFQVVKGKEGLKLEMSEDALGFDESTTKEAKKRIARIDKLLDLMSEQVIEKDNLDTKEQKALWHALKFKWEAELEASVPSGFRYAYENEESAVRSSKKIYRGLFDKLHDALGKTLEKHSEVVDSEILIGGADKSNMKAILRGIGAGATQEEYDAMWAHHKREVKESKKAVKKENYFALGAEDLRNRRNR